MFKRHCTILLASEAKAIASVDRAAVRLATLARRRNEHASTLTLTYDEQGEMLSGYDRSVVYAKRADGSTQSSTQRGEQANGKVFGRRAVAPPMPQGWDRRGEGL